MRASPNSVIQWILPLAFIASASWVVWNGATYIMAFGGYTDALAARYRPIMTLDYIILLALPLIALVGIWTVRGAAMEIDDPGPFDGRLEITLQHFLLVVPFGEFLSLMSIYR